ncbi:MAG: methionyl-tRNA formyltransferase, partial [Clostridia bacterium]|nr:methionyl-tRNA formyltransferase [Clostridia bacterium]
MRILMMGTPDFAIPTLDALVSSDYEVVGVISQQDKPKGRGHHLVPTPLKEAALSYGLPVYQPKTLKEESFMELLTKLAPDLIVVVAYGKILPKSVLDFPQYGCVNVHASLLPKYRGAGPIQWSIINGETETGVTTMQMGEGLDTGDILLQERVSITDDVTADDLFDTLATLGGKLLI